MNGRVLQVLVTATVPIGVQPVAWAEFVRHAVLLAAVTAHPIRSRRWRSTASAHTACRGTIRREALLHVKHRSVVNDQHHNVRD
jgi:hypothetical protein